ncbi:phosphatase PAP2 family protein [Streptomyces sp. NPDC004609]|uniref:phosphatase PAP2 family protein n=1 Tax=Streptomyces sp. NPDC004609 TaxID=3364704 RepID=UPI0036A5DBB8
MHSPGTTPPTAPVPHQRRPRPGAAARAALVLGVLGGVLLVLVAVSWSPLMSFDRSVARALHRRAVEEPGLVHVNRVLTDWVWDPWTMRALIAVVVLWLWSRREWLLGSWIAGTVALGTLVQQAMKAAVGRKRPSWPDPVDSAHYAAFPSGHAMTAVIALGLLLWLLRRRKTTGPVWGWSVAVAAVSVAGVGYTRLYLGVHWPTDVLGGWLFGACWVALSLALYPWAERTWSRRTGNGGGAPKDPRAGGQSKETGQAEDPP